jgi:putative (di)nucleoside polyphosphate hydrolase
MPPFYGSATADAAIYRNAHCCGAPLVEESDQIFLLHLYVIDRDGYRPNVGIILISGSGQVLWAKRIGQQAWQFPQGGIKHGETPEDALFRELNEELGLVREHVEVLGVTSDWLRYRLPSRFIRRRRGRVCIGQKQKWFALRLIAEESNVHFDATCDPEFDGWRWVDYWHPLSEVVEFKREVYHRALHELATLIGAEPGQATTL